MSNNTNKIKQTVIEYENIQKEITFRLSEIKPLRARLNVLKEEIDSYLVNTQQKGVKMGEKVIVREEKMKKKALTKDAKQKAICEMLSSRGIEDLDNVEDLAKDFLNSLKGPEESYSRIVIKDVTTYTKSRKKNAT